ncbi:flagellar hook-length control protein FliK [Bradyrhizobium lablabi]|uniref:flagellar hook-length control protein FliK n=1 Tax=Bradyrhizobium lablabi TaxID=722472 RepID=UPI001BA96136|nr:flagellar hook-length control protein FliK [Bradyrhizobium lablabi]MBR0692621.1 flagellar hook-length control protein FliK [Bradyrhizobium lablabi]
MPISINPVLPVPATQETGSVASELVLQAGSVVNAQVLKILSADLVRIAIASLSIDVQSEVPLQQGQTLQLAVSHTEDGIRLQLVGQAAASSDLVTLSADAAADVAANSEANATSPKAVLTPLERGVVTAAAQSAATVQGGQGTLFANLAAIASNNLPPRLQAAIAQVLAQQTSLDHNLGGDDIKAAFQRSGLLLEASLASGVVQSNGAVPDLKAALIVLRQALQSSLGATDATRTLSAAAPSVVPTGAPDLETQDIPLPQSRLAVTGDPDAVGPGLAGALAETLDGVPSRGGALNLIQQALRESGNSARPARDIPPGDIAHANTPPPPFRGAPPAAQAIAQPSIGPGATLATAAHHLLENTDAALARQTLLQVASLPDRIDTATPQVDTTTPRWNFEIPFLTPQGTAMAQFEISRDGGEQEVEAAKRVWKARFTLDVEPAGPVHALVSLSGERTSVRMWAERPGTAAQLRAGASQLSRALAQAELVPGEIDIRDGEPPQGAPARAGHFLDRAL